MSEQLEKNTQILSILKSFCLLICDKRSENSLLCTISLKMFSEQQTDI